MTSIHFKVLSVPSRRVFHFNGIEFCPTIEEFATIMGESKIDDLIFPTMVGIFLPCCEWCWASPTPRLVGSVSLANSTLG